MNGMHRIIDLNASMLREQLRRRKAGGQYEVSEIELVLNIRKQHTEGNIEGVQLLSEVLLERCQPIFQHRTGGLSHRPDLREEAISNMMEHLLREAQDSSEIFMTQNFIHYVRCLCADEFTRILRQEGLSYRRDDDGHPAGRPSHVPRALMEPLRPTADTDEGMLSADVADPEDQYEQLHSEDESQRILRYLSDPLDRRIVYLRAVEGWKWDDIAEACDRTDRTVRLRFDKARSYLQECLKREEDTYPFAAPQQ